MIDVTENIWESQKLAISIQLSTKGSVERGLAVESFAWKERRFWRQRLSFSASISQAPIL
jgi:hypothetical protein